MKNIFKKVLILTFILVCAETAPIFSNILNHPFDAKVIYTQWFDIIFEEENADTAMRLAAMADDVYLQANHDLGVEPKDHLCVVVSGVTQNINAYWYNSPYDHLCIYDAAPDAWDLASYKETLRSVFYHELVHHVTLTMTDPESSGLRQFIDRYIYLGNLINMSLGFAEGATVSKESEAQAGRLQNGYVLHTLVQAKAEGLATRWEEMSGARDARSIGSWGYYMGGAFSRYLQDTYGDELYTRFWQKSSHFNILLTEGIFKNVYGITLQEAWSDFYRTIPAVSMKTDFVDTLTGSAGVKGYYENLIFVDGAEAKGIFVCDYSTRALVFFPMDEQGRFGKPETLKEIDGYTGNLAVSADGAFYALSGLGTSSDNRYETQVYTIKGKKVGPVYQDMRLSAFVTRNDGSTILAGARTKGYRSVLTAYELNGTEPLFEKEFSLNDELYALSAGPDNTIALLEKDKGIWKFVLVDVQGNEVYAASFPEYVIPRFLSQVAGCDNRYTLSLAGHTMDGGTDAVPGSVPRSAELTVTKTSDGYETVLAVDTENVFGGLYQPVMTGTDTMAAIRCMSDGMLLVTGSKPERTNITLAAAEKEYTGDDSAAVTFDIKRYNPLKYWYKVRLMPMEMFAYEPNIISAGSKGLGLSVYSCDPSESYYYMLGAGYNPFVDQISVNLNISADNQYIDWSAFTQLLSIKGNMYLYNNLLVSNSMYLGNRNWTFSNSLMPQVVTNFSAQSTQIAAELTSTLSYAIRYGNSIYEKAGFAVSASPSTNYYLTWDTAESTWTSSVAFGAELYIPTILGFSNPDYLTLNMPAALGSRLILSTDKEPQANGSLNIVLFSNEIQRSLLDDLYFNRFTVRGGITTYDYFYMADSIEKGTFDPLMLVNTVSLECYTTYTCPFGNLVHSPIQMGGELIINPREPADTKVQFNLILRPEDR